MDSLHDAARAFRDFFDELRDAFLERDALLTQIELGLLCREHVLVTGPPGTAKSAIAGAVLGRILDKDTGQPSLFAKQISELTVQTDLIGAVDFKVLTETGRTEYLTEDGMLGATHAFLDEVFDGRDMLLRSILNVLHERELKHGRKVTPGRTECVIMTSNRYLSEVLARSPELLLAFADRLSFISFVPKAFAQPQSRASMLTRANNGQRFEFKGQLFLQQLDVLQRAVEQVHVSSTMMEALETLADRLEKELLKQVARMPDYVPTKYFSNRSVVKALWALKAAVMRDRIWRHPDRELVATPRDLDALRSFFLLGGPAGADIEALLKTAVDPRERAQLEILRLEHKAFDESLSGVLADATAGVAREAQTLRAAEDFAMAEAQVRNFNPEAVLQLSQALQRKLSPGPRHPDNRNAVMAAARMVVTAVQARLARGSSGQTERGGVSVQAALRSGLELARAVPELAERLPELSTATAAYCQQTLELIALSAESTEFDTQMRAEQLPALAANLDEDIDAVHELGSFLSVADAQQSGAVQQKEQDVRRRAAVALRAKAERAFSVKALPRGQSMDEVLLNWGRRLAELEEALAALSPSARGLKQELMGPLGRQFANDLLGIVQFHRTEEFAQAVRRVGERLRQEGLSSEQVLAECRTLIEERLARHAATLGRTIPNPPVPPQTVLTGDAYTRYREDLAARLPEGELRGLLDLERALAADGQPSSAHQLTQGIKVAVASVELTTLQTRVRYLQSWLAQLLQTLPDPSKLTERTEAERAFDGLVKSRFPALAMKEGEFVRLSAAVSALTGLDGELGEGARTLLGQVDALTNEFSAWSRRLLEVRSRL